MRACEADRCEAGATVNGRWCERHGVIDDVLRPVVVVDHDPPEYALEAPSDADPVADKVIADKRSALRWEWLYVVDEMHEAERTVDGWRAQRVRILDNMRRTGMSLGDIAEVTGLTRQRIGQLLR